ncbi:MAG: cupin domain-containing protein [Kiloniellales bacterium]|nr:cupin domain-containing protein [Kiloniellales bacterium]
MSDYLVKARFSAPVDRHEVAKDWRTRGYSCGLFVDPPGREWLDFIHDCNELVTVAEGRLKVIVSGETLIAEEGDEVFIPKGAMHSVINISASTSQWLYGYDR